MFKIRTWEPGPVLGNLDLNRSLVGDPYSGTWTRTREPGPVLGNLPYSFMYSECQVREAKSLQKNHPIFVFLQ